jgi:ABC-type lipoprotein export system ATPase subunit
MSEAIVDCQNLIKIHKQGNLEVVALHGLDFKMARGEFISVVGKSGAGKSTLLRILAGLDLPSAGKVSVADLSLTDINQRDMTKHYRRRVGFLWQDFNRNLLPYLKAQQNIELPMLLAGVGGRERKRRAKHLLEATGLQNLAHATIHTMSGGQQQRLALCVALAGEPELLLADEPTGELDTETSMEIYELLRGLNQEGLSILVVTHDVVLAKRSDRVVRLADGRLASQGAGEDYHVTVDATGAVALPRDLLLAAGVERDASAKLTPEGILIQRREDS